MAFRGKLHGQKEATRQKRLFCLSTLSDGGAESDGIQALLLRGVRSLIPHRGNVRVCDQPSPSPAAASAVSTVKSAIPPGRAVLILNRDVALLRFRYYARIELHQFSQGRYGGPSPHHRRPSHPRRPEMFTIRRNYVALGGDGIAFYLYEGRGVIGVLMLITASDAGRLGFGKCNGGVARLTIGRLPALA